MLLSCPFVQVYFYVLQDNFKFPSCTFCIQLQFIPVCLIFLVAAVNVLYLEAATPALTACRL